MIRIPRIVRITEHLRQPAVALVVLDDSVVGELDRGWMLAQVRKHAPRASLLYIASQNTPENERRARTGGADFYTAKPLEPEHFAAVLRGFLDRAADRRIPA
jgi:DNA-binding response OmpR family regulator